jgi:hypothetical protein
MKKLLHFALQSAFVVLLGLGMIGISPHSANAQCDIEVTVESVSWGDETNWTLTDNDGVVVLSGGPYGNGYSDTQTLSGADNGPYTLSIDASGFNGDNNAGYTVLLDAVVVASGTTGLGGVANETGIAPACTGAPSAACDIEVTVESASWGDETNWTLTDNDGVVVLFGGPYGNGYSDTQTLNGADNGPYTLSIDASGFNGDNNAGYTVLLDAIVVASGTTGLGGIANETGIAPACTGAPAADVCCSNHLGLGCENAGCEAFICGNDPFCCNVEWDSQCAADAIADANSGGPCAGASGCPIGPVNDWQVSVSSGSWGDGTTWQLIGANSSVLLSGGPYGNGYSDIQTVSVPVSNEPVTFSIVSTMGDNIPNYEVSCVAAGVLLSGTLPGATSASIPGLTCAIPETCCTAHGGTGCDDAGCEAFICGNDPFCCNVEWDGSCASDATDDAINGGPCESVSDCPAPPPACNDLAVNVSSTSWGDGTTWTLTDNDGVVVLSGGPYGNGYADTQTLAIVDNGPYTLSVVSTMGDNSPNYSVSLDGTTLLSGLQSGIGTSTETNIASHCIPAPCVGVPNAGFVSSPVSACPGDVAVLTATGLTLDSDITYQWQESPDGVGGWADVIGGSGANTGSYTTTAIASTRYFRIVTTCSAGPDSNVSNVVTVNPDSPVCQCTPNPLCASNATNTTDEWISNVSFAGIDNPSGSTGYSDFRCEQGTVVAGSVYSFTANVTNGAAFDYNESVRLYIDWNQDDVFGPGEVYDIGVFQVLANSTLPFTADICVPYDALPGVTNMRVYLKFSTYAAATGCEVTTWGEVEDYWVEVLSPIPAPVNDECASAVDVTPVLPPSAFMAQSNVVGNMYGAVGANFPLCGGDQDVFYSFNVPTENHYWVNVNPFGGFDAEIQVLDACGGTVLATENSAGAGQQESAFLLNLVPGDYFVRVLNVSGTIASSSAGGFLVNIQSFPTAQVQANPANFLYACNTTDRQLEDLVGASPQTGQLAGILDYEWYIERVGGGFSNTWVRGAPNYSTKLTWLNMQYGETYNVYVRLLYNVPGVGPTWGVHQVLGGLNPQDAGASTCTISTSSSVTQTEVRPPYTPTNIQGNAYAMCNLTTAFTVADAENYEWEFDNGVDPAVYYVRGAGNPHVKLSWVDCLKPNNTYQTRVRAQVDGQWGTFGNAHPLEMAPTANTALRSTICGTTRSLNKLLLPNPVCIADSYEYELVNTMTSDVHTAISTNAAGSVILNSFTPPLVPGAEYSVRVKATQCGEEGDFSAQCNITIAGPQAEGDETPALREMTENSATLYPNPNAGTEVRVELDGLGDGNHEVMIQIYDIYGKLIQTEGFGHAGSAMSRLVRFDGNMAMGMYMVQIVVDGERFATERLVIK